MVLVRALSWCRCWRARMGWRALASKSKGRALVWAGPAALQWGSRRPPHARARMPPCAPGCSRCMPPPHTHARTHIHARARTCAQAGTMACQRPHAPPVLLSDTWNGTPPRASVTPPPAGATHRPSASVGSATKGGVSPPATSPAHSPTGAGVAAAAAATAAAHSPAHSRVPSGAVPKTPSGVVPKTPSGVAGREARGSSLMAPTSSSRAAAASTAAAKVASQAAKDAAAAATITGQQQAKARCVRVRVTRAAYVCGRALVHARVSAERGGTQPCAVPSSTRVHAPARAHSRCPLHPPVACAGWLHRPPRAPAPPPTPTACASPGSRPLASAD